MSEELPSTTVGEIDDIADPVLLDVREPDEYAAGHAPDAVFMPLGTVSERWSTLPGDRPVVCVCRSGARSARVTAFLLEQGLDAANLAGGMQAWARFGLEVVCDDGTPGAVI